MVVIMKTCKSCKWSVMLEYDTNEEFMKCTNPKNMITEKPKVDRKLYARLGIEVQELKKVPNMTFCSSHRMEIWLFSCLSGLCGKSGRWWEPKND